MICEGFPVCAQKLKREESIIEQKRKQSKKRGKAKRKEKAITYNGNPCQDEQRTTKCVNFLDCRSKPSCTEKGKTYTLDQSESNNEVLSMHIDGGVIDEPDSCRCDYAFFVRDRVDNGYGRAIFVELKGGATRKALKQLIETLNWSEVHELAKVYKKIYCRIVNTSSVPRIQSTNEYMELKEILSKFGGNLKTGEWNFVERYEEIDNR